MIGYQIIFIGFIIHSASQNQNHTIVGSKAIRVILHWPICIWRI